MSRKMFLNFGLETQPTRPKSQRRTWKPSDVAAWILLIDGKYNINGVEYAGHPYTKHYVSKGLNNGFYLTHRDDQTCVPCYLINRKGAKNIGTSPKVLMTAFYPGWFHLVEKSNDKGTYKQKEPCRKPQFCPHCTGTEEPTYGRRLPWGMSGNDASILKDRSIEIAKMCKKCGGEIYPLGIVCRKCKHIFYDLTRIAMEHTEIINALEEHRSCPNCGTVDYLTEILKCSNDCDAAVRCSIFDVLLKVKTVTTSKGYTQLAIVEHSKPITLEEILIRDNAQASFQDHHVQPVDPGPYIDAESAEEQAAKLGCENPFGTKARTSGDDNLRPQ